jgi:hypothetical protein
VNGLRNCNSIQSVPWLDSFTKQHCMDILNDTNEDDDGEDVNDDIVLAGGTSTNYSHIGNSNTYSSALDPSDGNAYLVVELQQCDIPIVYHEQSYGTGFVQNGPNNANTVNPSGSSGGNNVMPTNAICSSASGSITALDSTLYHHQCMKHQQKNEMNKGDTGDDKSNSDTSSMYIDPNAIQMPDLVQALNESQEMGMKLVQVLDFESVHDNPVEEKYRTLQHELLRGLVDPALKPDASERSHLNAIIGGTSQHLTREEKGEKATFVVFTNIFIYVLINILTYNFSFLITMHQICFGDFVSVLLTTVVLSPNFYLQSSGQLKVKLCKLQSY